MTKAELIAELGALYTQVIAPELIESVGTVNKYLFHHLATGTDQDGSPTAHKLNKAFYVVDEGGPGEVAYYENKGPDNPIDRNIVAANPSAPTAQEIFRLHSSLMVRERVKGLMARAAFDIYNEDGGTPNHDVRMKWATRVLSDLNNGLNVMMSFVAMNATVLSGAFTDEDLRFIVNSNIDKWAISEY